MNLFGTGTFSNCGGHWSFPTFSINFAAPHLGFQILQVLVQGLKAEEEGAESTSVESSLEKFNALKQVFLKASDSAGWTEINCTNTILLLVASTSA